MIAPFFSKRPTRSHFEAIGQLDIDLAQSRVIEDRFSELRSQICQSRTRADLDQYARLISLPDIDTCL
jgi:hypothetical protein